MQTLPIHIVLLRKELRQLAPLLIAVLALGMFSFVLYEMLPEGWRSGIASSGYILLAIPALFSVGAGAMSVSQEKETRTLGWLSSLPLASKRLTTTKFVAAVIQWTVLWLMTIVTCYMIESFGIYPFYPFDYIEKSSHPIFSIWIFYWLLNSFYLLVCGFLTAWRFGTSMSALLAFIPLAIAPAIVRFVIAYVQEPGSDFNSSRYDPTLTQCLLTIVGSLAAAIWLMNRYAAAALAPQERRMTRNPYAASEVVIDTTIQTSQSVLSPCSAMLWQFYRQNKTAYISLCGLSLIAGLYLLLMANVNNGRTGGWEVLAVAIVFVVASWMGVLVFQGDTIQERIRFLAERGVTPFKAWITRQLLPFSFICLAALFYSLIRSRYDQLSISVDTLPQWLVFWAMFVVYVYSQWFAQLVRNPILSAIGAPMIAGMAFGYVIYAYVELTTVLSFTIILSVVPLIATMLMMRWWMDRRFQWQFWCSHLTILALAILLPIMDLGWYVWNAPRMPNDVKIALRKEGESIGQSPWSNEISPFSLVGEIPVGYGDQPIEKRIEMADKESDIETMIKLLRQQLATSTGGGINLEHNALDEVIGQIVLSRAQLESKPNDPAILKDYQGRLELLWTIASGLRRSVNLRSQSRADQAEISLIAELQLPTTKSRISPEVWERYIALVSNSKARNAARRRAVVACWYEYDQSLRDERRLDKSLGGFHPNQSSFLVSMTKYTMTRNGRIDHLAWALLRYLEAGPTASQAEKLELLRQRWPKDSNAYRDVNYGTTDFSPSFWIENPMTSSPPYGTGLPGDQWFAGWEQIGAKLNQ